MIRYLDVDEVLRLHALAIFRSGGSHGLRDAALLESAVAQPQMTFGGRDLYASLEEKAAAIGFPLASNMHLLTATNGSATPRWKRSWC